MPTITAQTSFSKDVMPKTPLVLIPGLICAPRLWAPQIAALSDIASCQVADHTVHASMAAIAQSILESAPERFALAGLSMGGYIAFEIMRQAPERIERLALLDTSALADTSKARALRTNRIEKINAGGFAEFIKTDWVAQMMPREKADDAALKAAIIAMATEVGADACCRQLTAIMGRADSRPVCETITCPATIIVGALDVVTPPIRHAEIHALIEGSEFHTVPGCGHLSTLEAPDMVSDLLRHWLLG
jgi:pimeloyl-ACP methyl ester carboxylesterase